MKHSCLKLLPALALLGLQSACNSQQTLARKATAGDPVAQYRYAVIIVNDNNASPQSRRQAIDWLLQSTAAGNRNAPAILGLCYTTGHITPKNLKEALHYLRLASDRDHHRAQLLLGHLYANGLGTTPSPTKAVEQIRYAAMQGSPQAAELMFLCFYDGFGVPRNQDLALGWLENAAEFGSNDAKRLLKLAKNPQNSPSFEKNVNLLKNKLDFFPKNR